MTFLGSHKGHEISELLNEWFGLRQTHGGKDLLIRGLLRSRTQGKVHISRVGLLATSRYVFYCLSPISRFDRILILSKDERTGVPTQPFQIEEVLSVSDVEEIAGKNGAVEFYQVHAELRSV